MSETQFESFTLPVEVEKVVPHRRPVCLIDRLVEYGESGVAEALISPDNPLMNDDGVLDHVAYMELIAQTYAAFKGYHDLVNNVGVKKGFLVVVKRMETRGTARLGDLLKITVKTVSDVGGFAVAEGVVTRDGNVLASGTITLWIP